MTLRVSFFFKTTPGKLKRNLREFNMDKFAVHEAFCQDPSLMAFVLLNGIGEHGKAVARHLKANLGKKVEQLYLQKVRKGGRL